MSREIKFQFLYKGLPFSSKNEGCNWHKKVYTLNQLIEKTLSQLSDVHEPCKLIAKRQFTGLKDKNGVEIYFDDVMGWDENEWGGPFNELVQFDYSLLDARKNDWSAWCEVIGNIHQSPELLEVNQ